jgi:uncharacterized oligopeptide transporter (OPT) family protein
MGQPCPLCGNTIMSATTRGSAQISSTARLQSVREFYEKNTTALILSIVITVISSFVGLFVIGLIGVIVGLVLGALSFWVGIKAITKVREIRS